MKKSLLISQESPVVRVGDDYHVFAKGYEPGSRKTPAHIAWILESEAMRDGWAVGRLVGCERHLMERFGVSRDTVREAIRVLEARGSMLMQRGRNGGLRLTQPDLDWAAAGFATFLRASAFSDAMLQETVSVAGPLLADLPDDHLVIRLYRRTLELLALRETSYARFKLRGFHITTRFIEHCAPIPSEGVALGSEELLCQKFSSSRATFRCPH